MMNLHDNHVMGPEERLYRAPLEEAFEVLKIMAKGGDPGTLALLMVARSISDLNETVDSLWQELEAVKYFLGSEDAPTIVEALQNLAD